MGRGSRTKHQGGLASDQRPKEKVKQDSLIGKPSANFLMIEDWLNKQGKSYPEIVQSYEGGSLSHNVWQKELSGFVDEDTGMSLSIKPLDFTLEGNMSLPVYARILKDDKHIGDLNLEILIDTEGQAELVISDINTQQRDLKADAYGKGFGTKLINHIEGRAKELGVSRVSLNACQTGGYFWATRGYDFDFRGSFYKDESGIPLKLSKAREKASENLAKQFVWNPRVIDMEIFPEDFSIDKKELDDLANFFMKEVKAGKIKTPQQAIQFGKNKPFLYKGQQTWFGKHASIGSSWQGVKSLG